ncbi:MAG: KH domain-containing protein [Limisphaerales bacterium]
MQAFLEYVVKGLVQNPDAVTVTPVERAGATVYELRLDPSDVGKIIGRQGITINAIRSLLLAGSGEKRRALFGGDCGRQIIKNAKLKM